MGKINWGRVVLGGLLAGVVVGVISAILVPLFAGAWETTLEALGGELGEPSDVGFMLPGTALTFATGIVAVWLYAAIRPRYGPGPKTAAIAGFAVWLLTGLAPGLWLVVITDVTVGSLAAISGPHIVSWVVATNVGAWVYRESETEEQAVLANPLG